MRRSGREDPRDEEEKAVGESPTDGDRVYSPSSSRPPQKLQRGQDLQQVFSPWAVLSRAYGQRTLRYLTIHFRFASANCLPPVAASNTARGVAGRGAVSRLMALANITKGYGVLRMSLQLAHKPCDFSSLWWWSFVHSFRVRLGY